MLFVFHHILADLWSMDHLLQELPEIYAAQRQGRPANLPPPATRFADYVRSQLLSVHGPNGEKAWAYWQQILSGELPVLDLPTDRPRPPVGPGNGDHRIARLGRHGTPVECEGDLHGVRRGAGLRQRGTPPP